MSQRHVSTELLLMRNVTLTVVLMRLANYRSPKQHNNSSHACFAKGALSLRYRLTNDDFDAPIGCASSKAFLITHPAKPGGSFATFTSIRRLPWQLYRFVPIECFICSRSLRYRLTNDFDDVHFQLIIEISHEQTNNNQAIIHRSKPSEEEDKN
eukprot:sb/3473288/